jgi:hypothetical protein
MVRLVALAPDAASAKGRAAILLQLHHRPGGYDDVQVTSALDAGMPAPLPHGGFGFPSFAACGVAGALANGRRAA